jgi:hypothetical protein
MNSRITICNVKVIADVTRISTARLNHILPPPLLRAIRVNTAVGRISMRADKAAVIRAMSQKGRLGA